MVKQQGKGAFFPGIFFGFASYVEYNTRFSIGLQINIHSMGNASLSFLSYRIFVRDFFFPLFLFSTRKRGKKVGDKYLPQIFVIFPSFLYSRDCRSASLANAYVCVFWLYVL